MCSKQFLQSKIEKGYDKKIKNLDEVDIVESGINAALENSSRASGIFESSIGNIEISAFLYSSNNMDISTP